MSNQRFNTKKILSAGIRLAILAVIAVCCLTYGLINSKKEASENNTAKKEIITSRTFNLDDYKEINAEYNIMPYIKEILSENQRVVSVAAEKNMILFIAVSENDEAIQSGRTVGYEIYELSLESGLCEKKCKLVKEYKDNRKINTSTIRINSVSPLVYYDYYDKAITVFSADYKKVVEVGNPPLDFSDNYYEEVFPDKCCFSDKYNAIFYVSENTSKLMKINYENLMINAEDTGNNIVGNEIIPADEYSEVLMECEYGLGYKNLSGVDNNQLYFESYNMSDNSFIRMVYDIEKNEYKHIYIKNYKSPVCSTCDDNIRLHYTFETTEPAEMLSQGDYTLYDCKEKKKYHYMKKNSVADGMSMGNGFIVFTQTDDESAEMITEITLWKYAETDGETFEEGRTETAQMPKEQEKIKTEDIETLENKYGINIVVGDDVIDQIPNYTVKSEKNTGRIGGALKEVDKALSIYPDSFFEELKNKSFINLNIYLVGSITPNDEKNLEADGVTCSNWGYECIALDILSPNIATTLIHEISHVTDEKLKRQGKLENLNDKWMECNPEDFEYYDSYSDYAKDYKNTSYDEDYWWEDNPEIVYFFDDYSKTFVKEDRARLLEHFNDFKVMDDCYNSSHIRKKLEVYFEFLKENFISFEDFEDTYWGKLSMNMFE